MNGDEREHEQKGGAERRGVHDEDGRCADEADQHACKGRASEHADACRALEERVRTRDRLRLLPEQLGQDHPLRAHVRRRQRAEHERDRDERPEREHVQPMEDGDQRRQRRPGGVGEEHRPPRPQGGERGATRDSEQRVPGEGPGEHEAHLLRRAGADEDEPRQRERAHLASGGRDDLGGEECGERPDRHGGAMLRPAN
jgi:hypothetical protein